MFRRFSTQPIAVVAVIAAHLLSFGSVLAADPNRLAWAPTREDAIVIDGVPSNMAPESTLLRPSDFAVSSSPTCAISLFTPTIRPSFMSCSSTVAY